MTYRFTHGRRTWSFPDLATLMARASPQRSGDELAGLAATSAEERAAAQGALAEVPLTQFLNEPLIPPEQDEVSRLILERHDRAAFAPVSGLTVGQFRDWLLRYETDGEILAALAPGLTPEMAAAVSKLMRNQDLILVASKIRKVTRFRNTLGQAGTLAVRLQPNHPSDDAHGIAASILDGLMYGCGDAVIGINPATDSPASYHELALLMDRLVTEYNIPTQSCVLAHVTTALRAMESGSPVDLVFQSIAGTEAANRSFGIDLALLREAREAALSMGRVPAGGQVMYFETGQGSCLSANAHHGIDQQTLEARAYAVAREFDPLLVNTVVGFIGPEYLYDGKQIIRAGLEDHFCGKLLGLPMGCDVCYTNHAEADQDDMDTLLTLLGTAGCNFIMGVPGAADVMLGYQSTSFHDSHYLRQLLGKKPAPEFAAWLETMGIMSGGQRLLPAKASHALVAGVARQSKIIRSSKAELRGTAAHRDSWQDLRALTDARIALGRTGGSVLTEEVLDFRLSHAAARDAVLTPFDATVLTDAIRALGAEVLTVSSAAPDRFHYLQRPDSGRRLSAQSRAVLTEFATTQSTPPDLVIIAADGLSTQASCQIPPVLAALLPALADAGWRLAPVVVAHQARVALQDEIGEILGARLSLMLLGERPGLDSADSLGAYFTWNPKTGRNDAERNCLSNIRAAGLPPVAAAARLFDLLTQARRLELSGTGLKDETSPPVLTPPSPLTDPMPVSGTSAPASPGCP
jgi:ethanolamine ammonia-lyase large subunit/ethanolamine ammonia-lyase small subunit